MSDCGTTLRSWHLAHGAAPAPEFGAPPHYGDSRGELAAARAGTGLVDLSARDLVEATGRDRVRLLHAMLSNDVRSLAPGQGCWATFNTEQGRVVAEMRVLALEDRLWIDLEPGVGEVFVPGIERFVIADKCWFAPLRGKVTEIGLLGPGSATIAEAAGAAGAGGLPPYGHLVASVGGAEVRVARVLRSSEDDLTVFAPEGEAVAVWDALVAAGARPVGAEAMEAARILGGVPRQGTEIVAETIPVEAGLRDRAIHWSKGCYRGQEVICRIDTLGEPAKRLVALSAAGGAPPVPGVELLAAGKKAGVVTSVARDPEGRVAALGYVKRRMNEPGAEATFESDAGPGRVRVERWIHL